MPMKVVLTPEAAENLERLPETIYARVWKVLDRLEHWPTVSGVKPLSGKLAGQYRMRTGDYRVQFLLRGEAVVVNKIGHRDGFYDQ